MIITLVNKRGECHIDNEDYKLISQFKWYLHSQGYATTAQGKILMHRLLLDAPKGVPIDHIDGNKLNNHKNNLRVSSYSENAMNRHVLSKSKNATGILGVHLVGPSRYVVHLWKDCKNIYLGSRHTLHSAATLRAEGELEYFGTVSKLVAEWLASHKEV